MYHTGVYLDREIDVENDILFMFCTSGTLGPSKLVQLTNQNAVAVLQLFRVACKRSKGSISCSAIPIFHIPSVGCTFGHLVQGCANVIPSNYNVMKLLKIVQEYKVTHVTMYASTFLEIAKCEVVKNYDVSSLKVVEVGASVTSQETKLKTKQKLNLTEVIELYGLTEAFPATVSDPILSKSGSVGFLLPNTKLKVEDIETRVRCVAGKFGEIMLNGPQVVKGYYKHPEATIFDKEGWLKTGDIGYFDADGNVYVTDRIKDVFKTPEGLQVFPSEIISLLLIHPKIVDAGVIGVPSNVGSPGEVPKAFIVKAKDTTLTLDDVIQFVKDKVAAYKQLRGGVRFVDRLPRSSSGKILKRILKEIE
ncbi:luciferin 4-monooxygenase-like [Ciona intestinalis]